MHTQTQTANLVPTFGGAVGFHEFEIPGTIIQLFPVRAVKDYGSGSAKIVGADLFTGSGKAKPVDPTSLRLTFQAPASMSRDDILAVRNLLATSLKQAGLLGIDIDQDHSGVKISAQLPLTQTAFEAGHKALAAIKPQLQ